MIYTVTLNPSIDYVVHLSHFKEGGLNRASQEAIYPGGKGIMVAKLLKNLGLEAVNLGFIGGFTGQFIKEQLDHLGIAHRFTEVGADTRINVKIKGQVETEINGLGPQVSASQQAAFLAGLDQLTAEDMVVLSGSQPASLPKDFYQQVIDRLVRQKVPYVLDTSGKSLLDNLAQQPFLIKPNDLELGGVFGVTLKDEADYLKYGQKCLDLGAKQVILSLGGKGAYYISPTAIYFAPPVAGNLVNSVGAGDSMIGGFLAGLAREQSQKEAFRLAVASGTATAYSPDIAPAELIHTIQQQVTLKEIK